MIKTKEIKFLGLLATILVVAFFGYILVKQLRNYIDSYVDNEKHQQQNILTEKTKKENLGFEKTYKIGFITDSQGYKTKKENYKLVSKVRIPLLTFVERMNTKFNPDFVVEGGDLIEATGRTEERAIADFVAHKEALDVLDAPYYHVLGNHELRGFKKEKWLELTNNTEAYYYFDFDENLRVYVLDANFKPKDGKIIDVSPDEFYTRGYIPQWQIRWLDENLQEANKKASLVFIHYPPLDKTTFKQKSGSFPANRENLRKILEKNKVRAVFSGHIEDAYHENINGVEYFVLPGFYKSNDKKMGEFAYKGVFSEIELTQDNINVKMFYFDKEKNEYQSLILE